MKRICNRENDSKTEYRWCKRTQNDIHKTSKEKYKSYLR